jgi:molybdopterin-guanine dinucleotide biosynthesis protein A
MCAGVVLAGGRSSRMGTAKAALEWHGSTLLRRTVGIVARATNGPVVVVRAAGQDLPELPEGTVVADDPREGKGPVQGIAAGLAALSGHAEVAFVSSTDMPFLHPAFIWRVLSVAVQGTGTDVVRRSPADTSNRWPPRTGSRSRKPPSAWSSRTGCGPRFSSGSAGWRRWMTPR